MEIYLVGGAIRDQLLGLPVVDRDWVVVGASPQQMLDLGYQAVGKDFPVFLHPETHEEYALARKERKTGKGYGGFDFDVDQSVSLEDDLLRRDLTINAMAQNAKGIIIDPHGGQQDLASRTLRHVSAAFSEDPLRVLRIARFYARLSPLGFGVHAETDSLVKTMVGRAELQELAPERIWVELSKGFSSSAPQQFFTYLKQCGAIQSLLPAIQESLNVDDLLSLVEPNVEERIVAALEMGAVYSLTAEENWAILCHAVGTPGRARNLQSIPPEKLDNPLVSASNLAVNAPKSASRLAIACNVLAPSLLNVRRLRPEYTLRLLELCDAFRQSSMLDAVIRVASTLAATDPNTPTDGMQSGGYLRACYDACAAINAEEFVERGLKGPAIAEAIRSARKIAIAAIK